MFELIKKKEIIGLLTSVVNASSHTKCVSLSNKKCEIQPTLINLHPNKYSQELHTIHLRLNYIDMLEVVTLLMAYLIKYVFQTKQKI